MQENMQPIIRIAHFQIIRDIKVNLVTDLWNTFYVLKTLHKKIDTILYKLVEN